MLPAAPVPLAPKVIDVFAAIADHRSTLERGGAP